MDQKGKWPNGLADAMREAGDMGPTELAKLVKTNKQNIDRWADQSRKLPLDFAEKIARSLKRLTAEIYMPAEAREGFDRVRHVSLVSAGKLANREPVDEEIGHQVVGGLPEDEEGNTTYKRYRTNPIRFEPVSNNPNHETIYPKEPPRVIGRVRRSILGM